MQERYGAHIVMGAGDWDMVDQSVNGFFNESYHATYWSGASRARHTSPVNPTAEDSNYIANAIYLRTTAAAPDSIATHTQDNPLFDATAWAPEPKGIILSACNCLAYKFARTKWIDLFPKAVIIGAYDRIVLGTWVSNAIAGAQMTDEGFWRDPQSILDQPGMCEQLEQQLTAGYPTSAYIGLLYKGNMYLKTGKYTA